MLKNAIQGSEGIQWLHSSQPATGPNIPAKNEQAPITAGDAPVGASDINLHDLNEISGKSIPGDFLSLPPLPDVKPSALSAEAIQAWMGKMREMLPQVKWGRAQRGRQAMDKETDVYKYLNQEQHPIPKAMNCWEFITVTSVESGLINRAQMKNLIKLKRMQDTDPDPDIAALLAEYDVPVIALNVREHAEKNGNVGSVEEALQRGIPPGHVMMFGRNGGHLAVSNGNGEMLENYGPGPGAGGRLSKISEMTGKPIGALAPVYWAPLGETLGLD